LNEDELVTGGESSDQNTLDEEELSDEEIYDVSTALCVDS